MAAGPTRLGRIPSRWAPHDKSDRAVVPTFAEYVPVVSAAVSAGTRRAYGSYWNRIVEHWGARRLDEPTPSEIRQLMTWVKTHVVARRNGRCERSTWWPRALPIPARSRGRADQRGRRPGPEGGQAAAAAVHTAGLVQHGQDRHAPPGGQLLRYADGRPITSRRYDHLWIRIGRQLPWVRTQQISTHWIRHILPTSCHFGFVTAQTYAGHEDHGRGGKAMTTYIRAGLPEVATALAALTSEDHPLAVSSPSRRALISGPPE